MKGVSLLYDETRDRQLIQIDLSEVDPENELIEDLVDILTAESRKGEGTISMEEMTRILKEEGKP